MATGLQRVLTAEQMRRCDAATIRSFKISGMQLMENAGRGAAEALQRDFGPLSEKRILIVCGKGNNGGDGFVVARHCSGMGAAVTVLLVEPSAILSQEARKNLDSLARISREGQNTLTLLQFSPALLRKIPRPDVIVDAMFGIGFDGLPRKPYDFIIRWVNASKVPVVSLDIPSGINGTTGKAAGEFVRAQMTLTFGLMKSGLLINQGMESSGEVELVDIGIPRSVVENKRFQLFRTSAKAVAALLPRRSLRVHKYEVGKVFVLAGSKGYTGAAALCANAVLRSGAGAIILAVPKSIYSILARKLSEAIVQPLPETSEGSVSPAAFEEIQKKLDWCDCAIIGPGLSQNSETGKLVWDILHSTGKPLLLDADALNVLGAQGVRQLRQAKGQLVVTPHTGEMSRLTGLPSAEIDADRIEVASSFARRHRVVVVLKGAPTVTAHPDGRVVINSAGNPGMATIGAGDVLAGTIAGMWAQRMDSFEASFSGVFVHGFAGDLAKQQIGETSVVASDILQYLPSALSQTLASR
jgi:NAD(P)H-hydrate epimerase